MVLFKDFLKCLESDRNVDHAQRIDRPMIWIYPLLYVLGAVVASLIFLY
jgi:hypothetical protein